MINKQLLIRQEEIFNLYYNELAVKTDRIFAFLFVFQWLLGIALALWFSPLSWAGNTSQIHIHVYMAVFLGGITAAFPIYLTLKKSGQYSNRYAVAATQIFFSILLIHVTGGRIETHFHVFVSLAFLATYRDFRPVLLATIITAADHLLRGLFLPESIYGVLTASPLRALEHTAWVIFEDVILFVLIRNGVEELKTIASQQAKVESTLENVEVIVAQRTAELKDSQQRITEQQQKLVHSSKMSSLGEMAGGIAHEINTPLAIINMRIEGMQDSIESGDLDLSYYKENLEIVRQTNERIAKIITGLSFFARGGQKSPLQNISIEKIIHETLSFCNEKFKHHGLKIEINKSNSSDVLTVECRAVEISQVILNLLNNAYDATELLENKWIQIDIFDLENEIEISITDSGNGIPLDIQDKILQPFFTTKEIGRGTGLGLSISKGIIEDHKGVFFIDNNSPNTKFTIKLPKLHLKEAQS